MPWRPATRVFALPLGAIVFSSGQLGCSSPGEPVTFCDVQPITADKCVRCHDDPTKNGAPFSLVTYADTQDHYEGEPVYERMARAVRSGFMPPTTLSVEPPVESLTDHEQELIGDWADAGASSGDCD